MTQKMRLKSLFLNQVNSKISTDSTINKGVQRYDRDHQQHLGLAK